MLVVQPIIGLILAWTGPWKRGGKLLATMILLSPYLLGGLIGILAGIGLLSADSVPVNTELSRTEYVERCEALPAEQVWRNADGMRGDYVTMVLVVEAVWEDEEAYYSGSSYPRFFECSVIESGEKYTFLLHDFRQSAGVNLREGDVIRAWGQVGGNETIYNSVIGTMTSPCINMLYLELVE
jgi:hypothetical protein